MAPGETKYWAPRGLSVSQITELVAAFAKRARTAIDAGVDVIEVYGAHGYLLHQFPSPVKNRRIDEYLLESSCQRRQSNASNDRNRCGILVLSQYYPTIHDSLHAAFEIEVCCPRSRDKIYFSSDNTASSACNFHRTRRRRCKGCWDVSHQASDSGYQA